MQPGKMEGMDCVYSLFGYMCTDLEPANITQIPPYMFIFTYCWLLTQRLLWFMHPSTAKENWEMHGHFLPITFQHLSQFSSPRTLGWRLLQWFMLSLKLLIPWFLFMISYHWTEGNRINHLVLKSLTCWPKYYAFGRKDSCPNHIRV